MPVTEGGETTIENLWLLCPDCHDLKTKDDRERQRSSSARVKRQASTEQKDQTA